MKLNWHPPTPRWRGRRMLCGVAIVFAGCASMVANEALLTYETVPEGAELFEGGKPLGTEPVTRSYKADGKSAIITTPEVVAVWPSGARTTFFTRLTAGDDRVATLQRPAAAPRVDVDREHARMVLATRQREAERLKSMQLSDIARSSARCKAQQSGNARTAGIDDCK